MEARGREGEAAEKRGLEAVRAKTTWWIECMNVYDLKVTGPYVAHDRFVVLYDMEFGEKSSPDRIKMSEVRLR